MANGGERLSFDAGRSMPASSGEFAVAAAAAWRTYYPGGDTTSGSLLSAVEERVLARRVAQGDDEARRQLIEANHRLVFHVVSRFRHTGVPVEDLIQEGNLGLIEAADRFDLARGCRFNTYALLWIRGAVLRAATRLRAVMPVPERLAQTAGRIRREEEFLTQELQRLPSSEELAGRVGLSLEQVEEARRVVPPPSSLDGMDQEDGRPPEEWLVPSSDPSAQELMVLAELREDVNEGLRHLTPREEEVLRLRFGLDADEPRSLAEVGRELSISRQRARELEQSALRRLRHRPQFSSALALAGD